MTKLPEIDRKEHERIIEKGIKLDDRLFSPFTSDSILQIEYQLRRLEERTGRAYVAVPVGQPYGGPNCILALPKEDVDAAHMAYGKLLRGVSPEIGRTYDLEAAREQLERRPVSNRSCYPNTFLNFLDSYRK